MHSAFRLLLALALVWGLAAPAIAQSVVQDTLTGDESWNAGQGPGGPGGFISSNLVRNSTEKVVGTIGGAITVGVTAAWVDLRWGGNILLTAQPTAAVVTMPPNPFPDGGIIGYCNTTAGAFAANVVTMTANTGQTVSNGGAVTTQAANTCAYFQFQRSNTTWYRIS
jgi:hypothetical protein